MEENYLIAVVVAAVLGYVLLKKDKNIEAETVGRVSKARVAHISSSVSGVSGVAKYLNKQEAESAEAKVTGVAKYMQEKELLNIERAASTAVSSVEKYLANKNETPVSGVSKYMAKKAVYAKKQAKENVSGVERYLSSHG